MEEKQTDWAHEKQLVNYRLEQYSKDLNAIKENVHKIEMSLSVLNAKIMTGTVVISSAIGLIIKFIPGGY